MTHVRVDLPPIVITVDTLYFAARNLPSGERGAYLAEACRDNTTLRVRVERMLAVSDQAENFITDPPGLIDEEMPEPGGEHPLDVPGDLTGSQIGRYRILERIGEGGCGVVYLAEQTEPVRRHVALKMVKPGMDSRQVVSRFEAERQALAMMDHPNIARVFDADTTPLGRPYFVMEWVSGARITKFCESTELSTRKRLELFIEVCQAVQHAHQKGVIHRDLKPSNILVAQHDGVPVPKVIDFGIAKAMDGRLTEAAIYTQLHDFVGTPAYMSPEQAEMGGLDIDTRSDIYSLGVILYELLVGSPPFKSEELLSSGLDAMRRTIREKQPVRPSTRLGQTCGMIGPVPGTCEESDRGPNRDRKTQALMNQLRGDLDWIVMKCLEKDRSRRYETANALAMDIKRHLAAEPVLARPPSWFYIFQKTVRRNKMEFGAAAALFAVLTAGILTSARLAVQATRARQGERTQRLAAEEAERRAVAQLTRAEWLDYSGNLAIAQGDLEDGLGRLALHYLNRCHPDLRGWEHRYLMSRLKLERALEGHQNGVPGVAFNADGTRLVTGSWDGLAKVWDAGSGRELLSLNGHTAALNTVAISPDGSFIVTGAGTWGEVASPGEAKVWDAVNGRELLSLMGHEHRVNAVAISPDGKRIATASDDTSVKLWDVRSGECIRTLEPQAGGVRGVAFSPDGARLATANELFTATVWSLETGEEVFQLRGHSGAVHGVAFSPDGLRLATASGDETARLWDAATGRELRKLQGHTKWLRAVAFSADGTRLATGGGDETVQIWNAASGEPEALIKGPSGEVFSVAFSPTGKSLATGLAKSVALVWHLQGEPSVRHLAGHRDTVASLAFSPDGSSVVTGSVDTTARLWEARTGRLIRIFEGHSGKVRGVAFSPDGKLIVTASEDRTARVWDVATGEARRVLTHELPVTSVSFSPDGQHLATGASDPSNPGTGVATVWDVESGASLFSLDHRSNVFSVAFSPDGRHLATGTAHQGASVWDIEARQLLRTFKVELPESLTTVAFSPDGKHLATGGFGRKVRLWDAATGQELLVFDGHTECIRALAFSPDGTRLLSGSDDRTAKIWETGTGQELLSLNKHEHHVWSVAFSSDGHRLITGIAGLNATATLWSAEPPRGPAH